MKSTFNKATFWAQAAALTTFSLAASAAELVVSVDSIKNDEGHLMAQLFAGEENYNQGKAHASLMVAAKQGVGQLTFTDLAPGEYVVRMFHDENNNQQMDANAFGMPTEGYGFSNQAVGNMGPPQYRDMVVEITTAEEQATTVALMVYL
ncbi:DUF2141 domain-containing protein [Marinicella meishanensis]|uniref:DUF2141 domain-containing protein n=1 Tax=Marinicella meishanensis TaxID=2873263 RepID=UPI001CC0537F|nr:DUF2141 domain-containing protein [Marinicella sp. NBU2979]